MTQPITASEPTRSITSIAELNLIEATVWKKIRAGGERHKSVTIDALCSDTLLSRDQIVSAIETLHMEGYIHLTHPDNGGVLSEIPEGITGLVVTGIAVVARPNVQHVLPMDRDVTREEIGKEEFFVDDDLVRATVLPERVSGTDGHSGRYILNAAYITTGIDNRPIIEDMVFDGKLEAWAYWDEAAPGLAPDPIRIVLSEKDLQAVVDSGFIAGDTWTYKETPYHIISHTSVPGEPTYYFLQRASKQNARYVTEAVLTSDEETDAPLVWLKREQLIAREMD